MAKMGIFAKVIIDPETLREHWTITVTRRKKTRQTFTITSDDDNHLRQHIGAFLYNALLQQLTEQRSFDYADPYHPFQQELL